MSLKAHRALVVTLCLFVTTFASFGQPQTPDPDQEALESLKKAGVDVSRVHKLVFFLYFPSKAAAQRAARQIKQSGFAVTVERDSAEGKWICTATKAMTPELRALQKIRVQFNRIAVAEGGDYDSWGGSAK